MNRVTWVLVGWLFALATVHAEQLAEGPERQKAHIVSRMYQATYGAKEICSPLTEESIGLLKAIDQVRYTYPELMRLVESSPYFTQAKEQFRSHWRDPGEKELKNGCQAIKHMLHQLLEAPGGRQAADDMIQTLSGKTPHRSAETAAPAWPPDVPGPKLPFVVHWDVGPRNSVVSQNFITKEYRLYSFCIAFRFSDHRKDMAEFKKLKKFAGDGSYYWVTKESAGTDNPIRVPEYTKEEEDFMAKGGSLVGGDYFRNRPLKPNERFHEKPSNAVIELTPSGAGTVIPIHIVVEQLDESGKTTLHTEKDVNTKGIESYGDNGARRTIIKVRLRPGTYRVTANTTRDTALLEGVETLFIGTWDARFGVIPDDK